MDKILDTFPPKKLDQILSAYMKIKKRQVKEMELKTPLVTLILNNGTHLNGRFAGCDDEIKRISFALITPQESVDICYLDSINIIAITLHDLHLCPEYSKELDIT